MAQVLFGVGNAVLREFANKNNIIALSKLKNVTIDFTSTDEKLYGGDSAYPFASFPKEKAIKISAENAIFSMDIFNASQGGTLATGATTMTDVLTVTIPTGGVLLLPKIPSDTTVVVSGYTTAANVGAVAAGVSYFQDGTNKKQLTFHTSDAGKDVDIVYDYTSNATAKTLPLLKTTLAKPFTFVHRIPIYNDSNVLEAYGQLTIYKCVANNAFQFNLQPNTAFAPKLELEAVDPKRTDGKLWDFIIEPQP